MARGQRFSAEPILAKLHLVEAQLAIGDPGLTKCPGLLSRCRYPRGYPG